MSKVIANADGSNKINNNLKHTIMNNFKERYTYENDMKQKQYKLMDSVKVTNLYCGRISLTTAWANECTIEDKNEQRKIRRLFKSNGFIPHFFNSKFSVEF